MQPKHKSLVTKLLIATGVDVLIFIAFILCWKPTPDESAIELLLLLAIFITNIGLAVAFRHAVRSWYFPLVLNSIISTLMFHLVLIGWYTYQNRGRKMQFAAGGKKYELILKGEDTSYGFYEKDSDGSSNRFMSGQYKISGDTVCLTDPVNQIKVCKDTLIGFAKEKIALKEE
ncbi:MAG TPA: hypothetical protein VHE59_01555 [Mucilaginibacter sp.]|nr:hypothetical protein [Mucilaginibacter sp.]